MDTKQFTLDAIRTESVIEDITIEKEFLNNSLEAVIASGKIADQIKRRLFYKTEYDRDKVRNSLIQLKQSIQGLSSRSTPDSEKKIECIDNTRAVHGLLGVITEAAELAEALQKYVNTGDLDHVNVAEEVFDVLWYFAILLDSIEFNWDTVAAVGIDKLKERFPEKFSEREAVERDTDAERTILETNLTKE